MFKKMKKNIKTNRTFDYSQGEITLNFTLSIENKDSLNGFKDLLEEAIKDIDISLLALN